MRGGRRAGPGGPQGHARAAGPRVRRRARLAGHRWPTRWASTSTTAVAALRQRLPAVRRRSPAPARRPCGVFGAQLGARTLHAGYEQQFGDLDGVEGGALAQVVVADEQRQAAAAVDAVVLADAPDVARVLAGGLERRRDVAEHDARRGAEQLGGPGDRLIGRANSALMLTASAR